MFWQMHDWLFANWAGENQGAFARARLDSIATSAGLDTTRYDACMATGTYQGAVRAETQQALASGIDQTPTLFVNGQKVVGVPTNAQLADLINQAAAL
jgi:protein-disulfide isomerase